MKLLTKYLLIALTFLCTMTTIAQTPPNNRQQNQFQGRDAQIQKEQAEKQAEELKAIQEREAQHQRVRAQTQPKTQQMQQTKSQSLPVQQQAEQEKQQQIQQETNTKEELEAPKFEFNYPYKQEIIQIIKAIIYIIGGFIALLWIFSGGVGRQWDRDHKK